MLLYQLSIVAADTSLQAFLVVNPDSVLLGTETLLDIVLLSIVKGASFFSVSVGGLIDGDTIYLNRLRVSKWGKEDDIDTVIAKITEVVNKGDMKLVNQIG